MECFEERSHHRRSNAVHPKDQPTSFEFRQVILSCPPNAEAYLALKHKIIHFATTTGRATTYDNTRLKDGQTFRIQQDLIEAFDINIIQIGFSVEMTSYVNNINSLLSREMKTNFVSHRSILPIPSSPYYFTFQIWFSWTTIQHRTPCSPGMACQLLTFIEKMILTNN